MPPLKFDPEATVEEIAGIGLSFVCIARQFGSGEEISHLDLDPYLIAQKRSCEQMVRTTLRSFPA